MRKILIWLASIFNTLVFFVAIGFTIFTFMNLSNWPFLLLWLFTFPIILIIIIFSIIVMIKILKKDGLTTRKEKLLKYLPMLSIINVIGLVLFTIILLLA